MLTFANSTYLPEGCQYADPLPEYWLPARAVGKGIGYPLETFARTVAVLTQKEEPKTLNKNTKNN